jgi:lipopolysaccharide transport system ATP-binding protein
VQLAAIVIIASHDQGLLRRTCTRIVSLDHGRVSNMTRLGAEPEPQPSLQEVRA